MGLNNSREARKKRFWQRVDKSNWKGPYYSGAKQSACWTWIGNYDKSRNRPRYGDQRAQRVAWKLMYGPLTSNQCVVMKCKNSACVNPSHMYIEHRANRPHLNQMHVFKRNRKLTPRKVGHIKQLLRKQDGPSQKEIATRYGVHKVTISDIAREVTWRRISVRGGE